VEEPDLFAEDMRAFFLLRSRHSVSSHRKVCVTRSRLAATAIGAWLLLSPSRSPGQEPVFPSEVELWLPAAMSEQDDNRVRGPMLPGVPSTWGGETLFARAEYRRPRRFGVTTEEKVRPE
jgi:hypothetical protein